MYAYLERKFGEPTIGYVMIIWDTQKMVTKNSFQNPESVLWTILKQY